MEGPVSPVLKASLILLFVAQSRAAIDPTLKTQVEAEAVNVFSAVESVQTTHRGARGKYWQGLRTHTTIPTDGSVVTADRLNLTADGAGNVSWSAKGVTLAGGTRSAYEVHEYVGPRGVGYILIQWVVSGGATYFRSVDRGPEGRSHDWQEMVTP